MSVIILIPYNKMFNTVKHRRLQEIQDPTVINADTDKDKGDSKKFKALTPTNPVTQPQIPHHISHTFI